MRKLRALAASLIAFFPLATTQPLNSSQLQQFSQVPEFSAWMILAALLFQFALESALIYISARFFLGESMPWKAVSVAGIGIPFRMLTGMVPFVGILIGLWGYWYLARIGFDASYLNALLVVLPVYALEIGLRVFIAGMA
ncbi:MAG: hypothetical protein ABEJ69_03325 [Candidatus Nanohaloarchaea archaeon]